MPKYFSKIFIYFLFSIFYIAHPTLSLSATTGQIITDPSHPNRMIYSGVTADGHPKPVILCGPGDPEDFFYNNTSGNITLLTSRKAKTIYITAYLKDRCSQTGGCTPGTGSQLDSTLSQWDSYITQLENAGITTVFFFFDDTQGLPTDWQTAVDKIVNKFKYHKLLIWSVAEEYSEAISANDAAQVAARIRQNDPDHIVGIHQLPGSSFNFNSNSNLQMFLMQGGGGSAANTNNFVISAFNNTGGKKILNMSEIPNHASQPRATVRQWNWASILGGASIVQVLEMGRATDPAGNNEQGKYDDCGTLTNFMETTLVNEMSPHNELKSGSTQFVLANPGSSYIAYTANASTALGIKSFVSGAYDLFWLDTATGTTVNETKTVGSGDQTFTKPGNLGSEVALHLKKTDGTGPTLTPPTNKTPTPTQSAGNIAPVAQNKTVYVAPNTQTYLQLSFTDNDGPGPYTYTLVQQAIHGILTGTDNDRYYTPQSGYLGTDSFQWNVNDGLVVSNIAAVTLNVGGDPGKPGDANGDGKVDGLDYVIWLNHYNQQATGAANGDFDNNGKVDGLDYVLWLNNYL